MSLTASICCMVYLCLTQKLPALLINLLSLWLSSFHQQHYQNFSHVAHYSTHYRTPTHDSVKRNTQWLVKRDSLFFDNRFD